MEEQICEEIFHQRRRGGGLSMKPILIAGPCAVESESQLMTTAEQLHEVANRHGLSLDFFRAGVWKPRSNPNSFTGVGEQALTWLGEVQRRFGFRVCTEVMTPAQVDACAQAGVTALWVGARTGVNPADVQKIADAVKDKPFTILVKNPLVPDLKLWQGNVERFLQAGVEQVVAVHRGFADGNENIYRNAPCWEIPIDLKVSFPELPILCDPSHLCGLTKWIPQIAQLALNYGFNGLMVECHSNPTEALSDADQQITPAEWGNLIQNLSFKINAPNADLIKQRALLEHVDTQLSELLAKRMEIVDEIARIKKENNLPVVQPQQWQQVKERYLKEGQDPAYREFLAQFLELLHQASIRRQK